MWLFWLRRFWKVVGRLARGGRRPAVSRLRFERLESRVLPATITWINSGSGNWDVAANWSSDSVPVDGDTVAISTSTKATVTIKAGDTEKVSGISLAANDTLSFTGGTLTVDGGANTLPGGLTMSGGTLTVTGAGTAVTVNGTTSLTGASLVVEDGAGLSLPSLTTYTGPTGNDYGLSSISTLEATGVDSVLSLANLTSLTGQDGFWATVNVDALAGGDVDLAALQKISGGPVSLESDGAKSVLDATALTSFTNSSSWPHHSSLQVTDGGTLTGEGITSLDAIDLTLDSTGTWSTSQLTRYTNGTFALMSGSLTLANVTDIDGSSFILSGGADLTLPGVTSYVGGIPDGGALEGSTTTWEASGAGSTLSLPNLMTFKVDTSNGWSFAQVEALAGGDVELKTLQSISGGPAELETDGGGSVLDVLSLTSFTCSGDSEGVPALQVTNGGTLSDAALATLGDVSLTSDGTGTWSFAQITGFTDDTLTLTGGTLTWGITDIDESSFILSNGANLTLPGVTSYVGGIPDGGALEGSTTTWEASGAGSTLSLPNLTSFKVDASNGWSFAQVEALAGGDVELKTLQSISGGPAKLETDGSGSVLDVLSLTSFTCSGDSEGVPALQVTNGGTLSDAALATLGDVSLTSDGTGTWSFAQITGFTDDTLTLTGGTLTWGITDIDESSFILSNGANLTLPGVTSYVGGIPDGGALEGSTTTWEASGAGSTLSLPNLTSFKVDASNGWSFAQVEALAGGDVELKTLQSISGGPAKLETDGSGSVLDVSSLTSFTGAGDTGGVPALQVTNGGTLSAGTLATLGNVTLTLTGGSLSLSNVTGINGSSFEVSGGASLSLPAATGFTGASEASATWEATGTGSVLSLSELATVTADDGYLSQLDIEALAGGDVDLAALQKISGGPVDLESNGTGSVLQLPELNTFSNDLSFGHLSELEVADGGTLSNSSQATISEVEITLDGTGTWSPGPSTSLASDTFTLTGGSVTFNTITSIDDSTITLSGDATLTLNNLTDVSGASFNISGASTLSLPAVTSYTGAAAVTDNWYVSGASSALSLPALTSLSGDTSADESFVLIQALAGAAIDFPALQSITGGPVFLESDGTGSVINATALTTFAAPTSQSDRSALDTSNLGVIDIEGFILGLPASGNAATIDVPQLAAGIAAPILLGTNGTFSGGTTVELGTGETVEFTAGTFTGGVTFDVPETSTVVLSGGYEPPTDDNFETSTSVTYSGTLTGSGGGTVQFGFETYDYLLVLSAGLTLNFAGNMFQWDLGTLETQGVNVSNLGMITLTGANTTLAIGGQGAEVFETASSADFDNYGTVFQTGGGALVPYPAGPVGDLTRFVNEPDASYVIEADSGIVYNDDGVGSTAVVNEGTIGKTGGTGESLIDVNELNNTGMIEAESGTIDLDVTQLDQLSGSSPTQTLTGGTFEALDGAIVQFPSGTAIATNDGTLALGGSTATIQGISGLATNNGTFSLTSGAPFTTVGNFSNAGTLVLGGTLTVAGNFTQTSSGILDIQIANTPASSLFGQLTVSDAAGLAGVLNVALVGGYGPSAGQTYPIVRFVSETGSFSSITGLSPYFTKNQTATALDLMDTGTSAVDLAATNVTAPTAATVGQQVTITWTAEDLSTGNATGNWQDSVYLSTTDTITASAVLLGSIVHTGVLDATQSYQGSLQVSLPAIAFCNYYVLVQIDSTDQVPDPNRANNTLAAAQPLDLSLPTLTLGQAFNDSFSAADEENYYQLTVPAGGSLTLALHSSASSGALALYVSEGSLPTPYSYQYAGKAPSQPNQTVTVPSVPTAGTYYVLVYSVAGDAASAKYTLTPTQTPALTVSAMSPDSGSNAGSVTVEIDGTNFLPSVAAKLVNGGTTIPATAIDYVNASQVFATFDLVGATPNNYTLTVSQGTQSASGPGPFQVTAAGATPLQVQLDAPQFIRSGRTGTLVISYSNPTSDDIVAPLLAVTSTNSKVWFSTADDPTNFTQSGQILAVAASGPAGILRPGQSGELTLTMLSQDPIDDDTIPIQVSLIEPNQTIDWAAQEAALQPPDVSAAAWNIVWGNLTTSLGSTTTAYNAALAQAATYLSSLGETTAQESDVGRLWGFLESQANASFPNSVLTAATDDSLPIPGSLSLAINRSFSATISGRELPSIFGLGWATSWQDSLGVDSAGNATIAQAGVSSQYMLQTNGTYTDAQPGSGTLSLTGGIYMLTTATGTQYVFNPAGLLNYEQDANDNRITVSYDAQDVPTALTWSNSGDPSAPTEQLALSYNTQGLVSQVADSAGETWSYTYDSAGHLLSVTAPGALTTAYTYDTGSDPETANALLSITNPNGSVQAFTYEAETGDITSSTGPDGTDPIAYTYPGEGEVVATDSSGNQTTIWYTDLGLPARIEAPGGGIQTYVYNALGEMSTYTDAAGDISQYAYDANGNLTQVVNPLGKTEKLTYGPNGTLTSLTDADNLLTQYAYNAAGDLLSITYPDSSQQSFSYDPLGDLTETVEQTGDVVADQYNTMGLLARQTFADDTSQAFTYDARGDMLTATSYNVSGTATGTTTMTYSAAGALASIHYPTGPSLAFTYNALGQRTSSVDQSGFTIDYSYTPGGQLVELTDGSGNPIVKYTYNALGQLTRKTNGNGTFTTYAYDDDGNVISEVNFANATTVNSSFAMTYNALGQQTSATNAAGNTTYYSYDATGQLTQVLLSGGETITYAYNGDGDLTSITTGGNTVTASSNTDNEVLSVGTMVYTYNANGDLQSSTDSTGTATYSFNDLNQLVAITAPNGTVTSYQYSPLGYLAGTTSGGQETNYLVDPTAPGEIVAAYNGNSGSLIADYVYGQDGNLVSQTGPAGTGYYDFDPSGNTIGITDASGFYENQYSYQPFGQVTTIAAALPNPFTFAGKAGVLSLSINLFQMRNRVYDAATGQFVSNDPSNLDGGDTNLRRYAGNDPIDRSDPTGLGAISGILTSPPVSPTLPPPTTLSSTPGMQPVQGVTVTQPSGANPTSPTTSAGGGSIGNVTSNDPNVLLGPGGYGSAAYVPDGGTWAYTVQFENDGTVAAQDVTITQQLDPGLDWSAFQFTAFAFGSIDVAVPSGLTQYQTSVPYQNADGTSLDVLVTLTFSVQTGLLTATFVSLDPTTNLAPTGVFDGFLPPDDSSGIGEGSVGYTIQPKGGQASGTTINQQATVVFDTNTPIETQTVTNTLDSKPPASSVAVLPSASASSFTVSWSGSDANGPGIAGYTIYVSQNGGPPTAWLSDTSETSATFTGTPGDSYAFYSVAMDNAGLVEPAPTSAQASTFVAPTTSTVSLSGNSIAAGSPITVTLQARDPSGNPLAMSGLTVAFTLGSGSGQGTFGPVTDNGNGTYTATFQGTTAGSNTVTATVDGIPITTTAPPITVTPGPVSLSQSLLSVSTATLQAGGVTTVSLQARDGYENDEAGGLSIAFGLAAGSAGGTFGPVAYEGNGVYTATFFAGTSDGSDAISAAVGGETVTSASPSIDVVGAAVSTSKSKLSTAAASILSGSGTTITFVAKDAKGNQEPAGGLPVVFKLTSAKGGRGTFGVVTDHGNGTYTVTFTGTTAGSNTIEVTIGTAKVASTAAVKVAPGSISLATSPVKLSAASAKAGSKITVTFQPEDAAGNKLVDKGLKVAFELGIGTGQGTFSAVKYNANGTYTATFTGTTAGSNTITATVNGSPLTSAPAGVTVTPGAAVAANSVVTLGSSTVAVGGAIAVTLQAVDAYGNNETSGGLTIAFKLGTGAGKGTFGKVIDNKNGTYTVMFTGTVAGTTTIVATIGGSKQTTPPQRIMVI